MNYGPFVFLAAFFAMAGSWFGFVITPQVQVGRLQPTNILGAPVTYPVARPGLARQGLDVYRANGCAECHSQQIRQTGTVLQVALADSGTNKPAVLAALLRLKPGLSEIEGRQFLDMLPKTILGGVTRPEADAAVKLLSTAGAKAALAIVPQGPDLARGWGKRRTVAADFLYDDPVQLGSQRVGPDLANVGLRLPDPNWELCHLYEPRSEAQGSAMPACRFLFEKRPVGPVPSPEALVFPAGTGPGPGYEVLPRPEAKALAAYLLSLRADAPLFEAPMTSLAASTNAPAGTSTNAPASPATNAPGAVSTNAARANLINPDASRIARQTGPPLPQPSPPEEEREGVSARFGEYGRSRLFGRVGCLPLPMSLFRVAASRKSAAIGRSVQRRSDMLNMLTSRAQPS
jgi:ribosomal protein L7/L12